MTSSPFGLGIANLLLILIPGYLGLKGYLSATATLDSLSRIDKVLWTIGIGVATGILVILIIQGMSFIGVVNPVTGLTLQELNTISVFKLSGALIGQSLIGMLGGYLIGTVVYTQTERPVSRNKNLKQPWKTAVRRVTLGDEVKVVTQNNELIVGKLYRIGSPSKDNDILLRSAERIKDPDNGEKESEPIGVSYHHYRDISQVHFPKIEYAENRDHNHLVLAWKRRRSVKTELEKSRYGYSYPKLKLHTAQQRALELQRRVNEEE